MPTIDKFSDLAPGLTAPLYTAEAVVPDDVAELGQTTRALYVGGAGDLRVQMVSGDTVTLRGAVAGMIYPLRVVQVLATGTTATDIVGLS